MIFPENAAWRMAGMGVCVILGILILVSAMFTEQDRINSAQEPALLFDYDVLRELTAKYGIVGKKCRWIRNAQCFHVYIVMMSFR